MAWKGRFSISEAERGGEDVIRLIGPGGAGKTTLGALLAQRLGLAFVDLDQEFTARAGDISRFLDANGYSAYATRNVEIYVAATAAMGAAGVLALSSGFMTYPSDVHTEYERDTQDIASSPSTIVLLPSFDLQACVTETVRRQLPRSFSRSADREAQVIRARFPFYASLHARRVDTMRPIDQVLDDIARAVHAPDGATSFGSTPARCSP